MDITEKQSPTRFKATVLSNLDTMNSGTTLPRDDGWDEVETGLGINQWDTQKQSPSQWKPASTPKFSLRHFSSWGTPRPTADRLRPTAYLDGLRGFAALIVYIHHHELKAHEASGQTKIFETGFGYEGNYHFAAFPGIRQFLGGGHLAVSTFFVLSGYVLALKPLNLIQAGDLVQFGDHLASSFFRRWIRLFLPLIITTLVYITTWHLFGLWVKGIERQGSWIDEIRAFYLEFKNFSFVFKEGGEPWLKHNFHLWSIPVEMKGSIVIFTTLAAVSRCTSHARLWCQSALIFYFMYIVDGWYCAMFSMGMLLCDLDLLAEKGELPRVLARLEPWKDFIYYHLLLLSMFLGGVPSENRDVEQLSKSRGWYFLSFLKPQAVFDYKWFYLFWAATFLVAATSRIHWLKRFFETRFCQYLGRIAFSLYMVHGPVMWTLGERLYAAAGWVSDEHLEHIPRWCNALHLPRVGPVGLEVSLLLPHIILLPVTLALADITTRMVDTPSVKLAGWIYKRTLEDVPPVKQAKA
jgi:peptidoglycan/LPS O-acetylase OafA/YrhL